MLQNKKNSVLLINSIIQPPSMAPPNSMMKAKGKKGERVKTGKIIIIIIVYFNLLNHSASHYPIWWRKVMRKKEKRQRKNESYKLLSDLSHDSLAFSYLEFKRFVPLPHRSCGSRIFKKLTTIIVKPTNSVALIDHQYYE